jgi:outer membrane protein OmpA-like peptidoglycan-associated protein
MKIHLAVIAILSLGAPMMQAEETAAKVDADSAKSKLSGKVRKAPGKFIIKDIGGDPVTKRYYTKDALVITHSSGAKEEHPYVAVPLLFRANTDELLDDTSQENVMKIALILKDFGSSVFAIEGHASAEGDPQRNRDLSKLRAEKIQSILLDRGVPAGELVRVEGFGSDHARHPANAPDTQLQEDRRVLIVKER